jgi:hypothetical protein
LYPVASARKCRDAHETSRVSALFEEIAADTTPKGMVLGHRARLAWMSLFAVIAALAAIGFVGQRLTESTATAPAATLRLAAPKVVRGGLFFQSRVEIRAQRAIEHPRLVLAPTNVGHRSYDLELDDGDTAIARVERAIIVLP